MGFDVLTTAAADRWREVTADSRDLHFSLEYARVQERLGSNAKLAVWTGFNGTFVQPFLYRTGRVGTEEVKDIASMYGFGGQSPSYSRALARELEEWCWAKGVVSEFTMLHPLLKNWPEDTPRGSRVAYLKDVVVIDLKGDFTSKFSRRVRRGVKKAESYGATTMNAAPTKENILLFSSLYTTSMENLNAPARFRFSRQYFDAHFNEFGPRAVMFFVTLNGRVERALLTLRDDSVAGAGGTAYAHFLGSTGQNLDCGLDDLLYAKAARAMRDLGCARFHLGGGRSSAPDDSLLTFKSTFSDWRLPVKTLQRIFDRQRYDHLCELKRFQEAKQSGVAFPDFFPLYRREAA